MPFQAIPALRDHTYQRKHQRKRKYFHVASVLTSVALLLMLSGCTTSMVNAPINAPQAADAHLPVHEDIAGQNMVALSFSGGGLRAAAFALGVLEGLKGNPNTPAGAAPLADVLDDTTFITSVSGGSLTAAYYGLYGRVGLEPLRKDVLAADMEVQMHLSAWSPANWSRLVSSGGINDRHSIGAWLNDKVFHGATFADLHRQRKPDVWINATDMYNRTPFPFIPKIFSALCSDLASLPVAEAVYASMAVPLVFTPVVIKTYPEHCTEPLPTFASAPAADAPRILQAQAAALTNYRNPDVMQYVKLVDGGLTDNVGLSSILIDRAASDTPYGPFTAHDAVHLRQMLFVVVDAGRVPSGNWARQADGPSGLDIAFISTDITITAASRLSFDAFNQMVQDWRNQIVKYRCSLSSNEVARILHNTQADWRCDDLHFEVTRLSFADLGTQRAQRLNAIPTRLTLSASDIDDAVQAGKDALLQNPAFLHYQENRRAWASGTGIN